jgi:hypothetical protein
MPAEAEGGSPEMQSPADLAEAESGSAKASGQPRKGGMDEERVQETAGGGDVEEAGVSGGMRVRGPSNAGSDDAPPPTHDSSHEETRMGAEDAARRRGTMDVGPLADAPSYDDLTPRTGARQAQRDAILRLEAGLTMSGFKADPPSHSPSSSSAPLPPYVGLDGHGGERRGEHTMVTVGGEEDGRSARPSDDLHPPAPPAHPGPPTTQLPLASDRQASTAKTATSAGYLASSYREQALEAHRKLRRGRAESEMPTPSRGTSQQFVPWPAWPGMATSPDSPPPPPPPPPPILVGDSGWGRQEDEVSWGAGERPTPRQAGRGPGAMPNAEAAGSTVVTRPHPPPLRIPPGGIAPPLAELLHAPSATLEVREEGGVVGGASPHARCGRILSRTEEWAVRIGHTSASALSEYSPTASVSAARACGGTYESPREPQSERRARGEGERAAVGEPGGEQSLIQRV